MCSKRRRLLLGGLMQSAKVICGLTSPRFKLWLEISDHLGPSVNRGSYGLLSGQSSKASICEGMAVALVKGTSRFRSNTRHADIQAIQYFSERQHQAAFCHVLGQCGFVVKECHHSTCHLKSKLELELTSSRHSRCILMSQTSLPSFAYSSKADKWIVFTRSHPLSRPPLFYLLTCAERYCSTSRAKLGCLSLLHVGERCWRSAYAGLTVLCRSTVYSL